MCSSGGQQVRHMIFPFLFVLRMMKDLHNAASVEELTEELGLNEIEGRSWTILPSCATKGDGIDAVIAWTKADPATLPLNPRRFNKTKSAAARVPCDT